jgi:hypothetical protein
MADGGKLRIGYQKGGTPILLETHGTLEKRLALQLRRHSRVSIRWDSDSAELAAIEGAIVERLMRHGGRGATRPPYATATAR